MESIAPPLKCLLEMQSALQNGETVRAGLEHYVHLSATGFCGDVRRFLFDWDQGRDWRQHLAKEPSPYRRALLELAAAALSGQSIQTQLQELRDEVEHACEAETKERLDILPLHMLFPLLFFLFPAYLLLLFGPLVSSFLMEFLR